jgi:hypothetical protein
MVIDSDVKPSASLADLCHDNLMHATVLAVASGPHLHPTTIAVSKQPIPVRTIQSPEILSTPTRAGFSDILADHGYFGRLLDVETAGVGKLVAASVDTAARETAGR